jgi:hypothetical protein
MRRRDVLGLLGGAAVLWPRVGSAQQTEPVRRIAVLVPLPETAWVLVWDELRQHGYVEGATLSVDRRGFEARYEQFPKIVADLIQGKPDVIMCGGDAAWHIRRCRRGDRVEMLFAAVHESGIGTKRRKPRRRIYVSFWESGGSAWTDGLGCLRRE